MHFAPETEDGHSWLERRTHNPLVPDSSPAKAMEGLRPREPRMAVAAVPTFIFGNLRPNAENTPYA